MKEQRKCVFLEEQIAQASTAKIRVIYADLYDVFVSVSGSEFMGFHPLSITIRLKHDVVYFSSKHHSHVHNNNYKLARTQFQSKFIT